MIDLNLRVNGQAFQLMVHEDETLLDVLRNRLLLTGTKRGSGEGQCGHCTVILNLGDGIDYLALEPSEILTEILLPPSSRDGIFVKFRPQNNWGENEETAPLSREHSRRSPGAEKGRTSQLTIRFQGKG